MYNHKKKTAASSPCLGTHAQHKPERKAPAPRALVEETWCGQSSSAAPSLADMHKPPTSLLKFPQEVF